MVRTLGFGCMRPITVYTRDDSANVAVLLPGAAELVKYRKVEDPVRPL
jgi:hypothetical protein